MSAQTHNGQYETWVRRLRAWQKDPSTPLHDLPVLDDASFTPATYQRLLTHVEKALDVVTRRWSERLEAAFGRHAPGHDLARDLVAIRPLLARRVQLATHPHLPEGLRRPLRKECEQTLARLQEELEDTVTDLRRHGRFPSTDVDQLLRAVRENSLLRVLEMDIRQDGSVPAARAVGGEVRG